jgi:CubicO group peptidase (beta-lactamase class C family)
VLEDGTLLYGQVHDPTARIVNRGVSGNAGLFSTADDLAVVASMLMNGGVIRINKDGLQGRVGADERVRILSEATVESLMHAPKGLDEHGRTLGWVDGRFGDLASDESINHTGYTGTSMTIDQENGVAVILLTNRVHPVDDGSLARTRATVENIVLAALDN